MMAVTCSSVLMVEPVQRWTSMVLPELRRIHVRTARFIMITSMLALAVASLLVLTGCGDPGPTFVGHGASYTKSSALTLLAATDTSKFATRPTTDAVQLRHSALAALRRQGSAASAAADLLTTTLPPTAHGVPVYIELGSFGGAPATILVEATGPTGGTLGTKRLWALGKDGTVLFVGTR